MNPKPHPNHKRYLQILRSMTPEQRLQKAFELSEFTRQLFIQGLRKRFPNATEEEFKQILLKRIDKCHNRNYGCNGADIAAEEAGSISLVLTRYGKQPNEL